MILTTKSCTKDVSFVRKLVRIKFANNRNRPSASLSQAGVGTRIRLIALHKVTSFHDHTIVEKMNALFRLYHLKTSKSNVMSPALVVSIRR